jgi:OmpA-OmpF porin, OOP family
MKKMNKLALAAFAAAGLSASPAFAQWSDGHWYLGLGAGQATLKESDTDVSDKKQTAYTARIGYLMSRYLAVEGAYYDLGDYPDPTGSTKASSLGVALVGILPIADVFEAYGRIGYARSETKASFSGLGSVKSHENEAYYGIGARYMFSPQLGVFAEWGKHDKLKVEHWMLGAEFRF